MRSEMWRGSRRQVLTRAAAGAAGLAATALIGGRAAAQDATPAATPEDGEKYRLAPATPEEMGAPAVPAPTESTADDAVSVAFGIAPYAEMGTDAAPGEFPREVRHAMGTTTVESAPERVIALDSGELEALLAVGVTPVGTIEQAVGERSEFADIVADITTIGSLSEPDLEGILALAPDLIISSKLRHEELYPLLSENVPTVFAERVGVSFKYNFKLIAETVGREQEGSEEVARYETAVRELNAQLPAERPTISIVQIRPDHIRYYWTANFLGTILTDLGFPRNEIQNVDDFAYFGGQEDLGRYADGDVIILAVPEGTNELSDAVLGGDVWQGLPAVQNDRVMVADSDTFIAGVGYGSAMLVLDDLAAYFGLDPVST